MKKVIGILLVAFMALTVLPVFAADTSPLPPPKIEDLQTKLNQLQLSQYSLGQTEAWLGKWTHDIIDQENQTKAAIDATTAQINDLKAKDVKKK